MHNRRRRDYNDDYEYPGLHHRPDFYSQRRRIGQSAVAKLLSTIGEDVLKNAVFSIALAVPAIRRLVFRLLLAAFLLGAILVAALFYGIANLSGSLSRNSQQVSETSR